MTFFHSLSVYLCQ